MDNEILFTLAEVSEIINHGEHVKYEFLMDLFNEETINDMDTESRIFLFPAIEIQKYKGIVVVDLTNLMLNYNHINKTSLGKTIIDNVVKGLSNMLYTFDSNSNKPMSFLKTLNDIKTKKDFFDRTIEDLENTWDDSEISYSLKGKIFSLKVKFNNRANEVINSFINTLNDQVSDANITYDDEGLIEDAEHTINQLGEI